MHSIAVKVHYYILEIDIVACCNKLSSRNNRCTIQIYIIALITVIYQAISYTAMPQLNMSFYGYATKPITAINSTCYIKLEI